MSVLLLVVVSLAKTMSFAMLDDSHGVTLVDPHWMRSTERPRDPTMRQALVGAPMSRDTIRDGMTQASAAAVATVISAQQRTIDRLRAQLKQAEEAKETAEAAVARNKHCVSMLTVGLAARHNFVQDCWHNRHWTNEEAVRHMEAYTTNYRRLHASSQEQ